ncbi:hypothetical protein FA95DRAFT_173081 [Auriscalpium vulgare]|uniref:Uncharacterized protein n=1 Tax=Auriscalpium vulgare TaxID=40419 RepID=A0ACB8RM51_9AGAM|nr:hypothetical protein FA95DRAFT_173081 [Auriscalpium vulgare]
MAIEAVAGLVQDSPYHNVVPYSVAAIGALLVWDWLCTFDQEVEYVWSGSWNLGQVLFLLNRYPPFIDTFISLHLLTAVRISAEQCKRQFTAVTWLITSGVLISEFILLLRTYAIWERRRWVLILCCSIAAFLYAPAILVTELEVKSLRFADARTDGRPGCALEHAGSIIFISYVLLMISETIIFVLTAIKAVQHLRRTRSPMVVALYRDGVLFYFYILIVTLANVIVPVAAPSAFANWLATPQRALHSIMCTRVLLSIQRGRFNAATTVAESDRLDTMLSSLWLSSGTAGSGGGSGRLSVVRDSTSDEVPTTDEAIEMETRPINVGGTKDRSKSRRRAGKEKAVDTVAVSVVESDDDAVVGEYPV